MQPLPDTPAPARRPRRDRRRAQRPAAPERRAPEPPSAPPRSSCPGRRGARGRRRRWWRAPRSPPRPRRVRRRRPDRQGRPAASRVQRSVCPRGRARDRVPCVVPAPRRASARSRERPRARAPAARPWRSGPAWSGSRPPLLPTKAVRGDLDVARTDHQTPAPPPPPPSSGDAGALSIADRILVGASRGIGGAPLRPT